MPFPSNSTCAACASASVILIKSEFILIIASAANRKEMKFREFHARTSTPNTKFLHRQSHRFRQKLQMSEICCAHKLAAKRDKQRVFAVDGLLHGQIDGDTCIAAHIRCRFGKRFRCMRNILDNKIGKFSNSHEWITYAMLRTSSGRPARTIATHPVGVFMQIRERKVNNDFASCLQLHALGAAVDCKLYSKIVIRILSCSRFAGFAHCVWAVFCEIIFYLL